MVCKNCDAMLKQPNSTYYFATFALVALLPWLISPAQAERADRHAQVVIEADKYAKMDLLRQEYELLGAVSLTKGSLAIKAVRAEVKQTPEGYYQAVAFGAAAERARFTQRRDIPGESIEGQADRLEYSSKNDTIKLVGNAKLRRLRGSVVADEASGDVISYDNLGEVLNMNSAVPSSAAASSPRVRIVLTPPGTPASASK